MLSVLSILSWHLSHHEIDQKLQEKLITVMEQRIQAENQYLDMELPGAIDAIKLGWYQHMHNFKNPD